jgi:ribosomal protein S7
MGDFKARIAEKTTTVYRLGVDALVTPQEMVDPIKAEGDIEGHIEQPLMRTSKDRNQMAVVKLAVDLARKLVEKGKFRVDLAVCRIQERIEVTRCRSAGSSVTWPVTARIKTAV